MPTTVSGTKLLYRKLIGNHIQCIIESGTIRYIGSSDAKVLADYDDTMMVQYIRFISPTGQTHGPILTIMAQNQELLNRCAALGCIMKN